MGIVKRKADRDCSKEEGTNAGLGRDTPKWDTKATVEESISDCQLQKVNSRLDTYFSLFLCGKERRRGGEYG